jgi:hypothetical protein
MTPWKATRESGRVREKAAEREASVYVRIILEVVRDTRNVPPRGHAAFTRESLRSVDSAEPHS